MAKRFGTFMAVLVLAAALAGCNDHAHGQLFSHGNLYPNGPGISEPVSVGGRQLYVLKSIKADGSRYTLRTQLPPGGAVRMDIYTSVAAFNGGQPPIGLVEEPVYETPPYATTSEVVFTAQSGISGDYAVVVNGVAADGGFSSLYMQDLRLLSAGPDPLVTLMTSSIDPSSYTSGTVSIASGYLQVYSLPSLSSSGTYTISLYSTNVATTTSTISYPQLFVYGDDTLTIRSLLYSITTNTSEFIISSFVTTATGTDVYTTSTFTLLSSSAVVSGVTFTANLPPAATIPFILLKGVVQADYTLTVGP